MTVKVSTLAPDGLRLMQLPWASRGRHVVLAADDTDAAVTRKESQGRRYY
jgi:hypothetical protein